jgi:hypothetical protein
VQQERETIIICLLNSEFSRIDFGVSEWIAWCADELSTRRQMHASRSGIGGGVSHWIAWCVRTGIKDGAGV